MHGGCVLSIDIDAIMGFKMAATLEDAGVLAATAGMDQALGGNAFTFLADAVNTGKMPRAVLERAAAATLREKFAGRLFDKQFDGSGDGDWGNLERCRAHAEGGILDSPASRAIARRVAQEGTVLLKNSLPVASSGMQTGWSPDSGRSLSESEPATPACRFTNTSDCYGDGLGSPQPVADEAACCALCQSTPHCKVAVYIPEVGARF